MKNLLLLVLLQAAVFVNGHSQVVCVRCFDQNTPLSPEANNRIQNGGFESTDCTPGWLTGGFCPNSSMYSCDLDNWTCTGGGQPSYPSIFDSTLCLIPEGKYAAYFGNGNAFVCVDLSFDTSCMMRDRCTVSGFPTGFPKALDEYGGSTGVSLEQSIGGLTTGETYVLEFWAGGEPLQGLLLEEGVFAVDVGYGKIYLTSRPTEHNSSNTGTVHMIQFIATSLTHTIRFTNWGHICVDCTELVIDNVRLYSLAELSPSVEGCITSVDKWTENEFPIIYPNPTHGMIYWEELGSEDFSVSILSPDGKMLKTISGQNEIDVSSLARGVYLLLFEQRNRKQLSRFVKL